MGAFKSAISSATGLIIALPIADPMTFSISTFGGWKHMLTVIGFTVLVAEARFWKQWADAIKATPPEGK